MSSTYSSAGSEPLLAFDPEAPEPADEHAGSADPLPGAPSGQLDVSLAFETRAFLPPGPGAHLLRLNLLALGRTRVWFALDRTIVWLPLTPSVALPLADAAPSVVLVCNATVNQLRVGEVGGLPVLAATTERGQVAVVWLASDESSLPCAPLLLAGHAGPSHLVGAWGLTLCPHAPWIASSANTHKVYLFDLSRAVPTAAAALSASPTDPQAYSYALKGHGDNIPAVAWAPCLTGAPVRVDDEMGALTLASASIDGSVILWRGSRALAQRALDAGWCWALAWVDPAAICESTMHAESGVLRDHEPRVGDSSAERMDVARVGDSSAERMDVARVGDSSAERMDVARVSVPALGSLVLVGAVNSLVLVLGDESLAVLARVALDFGTVGDWREMMNRASLLAWVPELSLVLVGSAGAGRVLVLRLTREPRSGKFNFTREATLPTGEPAPEMLVGMASRMLDPHEPSLARLAVVLAYADSSMSTYTIRACGADQRLDVRFADL